MLKKAKGWVGECIAEGWNMPGISGIPASPSPVEFDAPWHTDWEPLISHRASQAEAAHVVSNRMAVNNPEMASFKRIAEDYSDASLSNAVSAAMPVDAWLAPLFVGGVEDAVSAVVGVETICQVALAIDLKAARSGVCHAVGGIGGH